MRKIMLTLMISLIATGPSFAQSNIEMMRVLTINALVQYGQKLYDRGDFNEASAVFDHVLTFDDHQAQALAYLKDMGRLPTVPDEMIVKSVNVSDTESLKSAIEAQKRVIGKLQAQIKQMRANLAAESAGSKLK